MAVNNEVGTIQNIPAISGILGGRGILFHCDAAQAPCAMDMGNLAAHADLISLSGHKMYGPQGIGALYIRRDLQPDIEPIIYGGGQQNGLRSGTLDMGPNRPHASTPPALGGALRPGAGTPPLLPPYQGRVLEPGSGDSDAIDFQGHCPTLGAR